MENNCLTLNDLSNAADTQQIVMIDPFAFRETKNVVQYLNARCTGSVSGVVFTGPSAGRPVPDVCACMSHLAPWMVQKPASTVVAITAHLDPNHHCIDKDQLSAWKEYGLKMILWECGESLTRLPDSLLWQVSRQGIWNHVSGPGYFGNTLAISRFIQDNPHIVHSCEFAKKDMPVSGSYDKVSLLPGRPVWEFLENPVRLLACLARYAMEHMIRMRFHDSRLITLGRDIVYHFQSPADLPPGYMDMVCAMVEAGGSVNLAHVRSNLTKAHMIGYAVENGVIVGSSCLKHPRKVLIERLKKTTDLDLSGFVERGYTSVRPEYRSLGVGRKLLEGLTKRADPYKVFSIIDEDNLATQKIAQRNNTRKIVTYFSEKTHKYMGIWMPEQMVQKPENKTDPASDRKNIVP